MRDVNVETDYGKLEAWFLDRIEAGENEEIGSVDFYEDETGYIWFINKVDENEYVMSTMLCPLPFATGKIDENGEAKMILV